MNRKKKDIRVFDEYNHRKYLSDHVKCPGVCVGDLPSEFSIDRIIDIIQTLSQCHKKCVKGVTNKDACLCSSVEKKMCTYFDLHTSFVCYIYIYMCVCVKCVCVKCVCV